MIPCSSFEFPLSLWVLWIELGLSGVGDPDPAQWHQRGLLSLGAFWSQSVSILAPDLVSSFSVFDTAWDILARLLTRFLRPTGVLSLPLLWSHAYLQNLPVLSTSLCRSLLQWEHLPASSGSTSPLPPKISLGWFPLVYLLP